MLGDTVGRNIHDSPVNLHKKVLSRVTVSTMTRLRTVVRAVGFEPTRSTGILSSPARQLAYARLRLRLRYVGV